VGTHTEEKKKKKVHGIERLKDHGSLRGGRGRGFNLQNSSGKKKNGRGVQKVSGLKGRHTLGGGRSKQGGKTAPGPQILQPGRYSTLCNKKKKECKIVNLPKT